MHHHPLSPPPPLSAVCRCRLNLLPLFPVTWCLEIGSLLSTICLRLCGVSAAAAVGAALKFGGLLTADGRTDGQRCSPQVCASTLSAWVHFTWEPFNHTMDSWTVASTFLLIGLVSCAALSAFDTGKSKTLPPRCLEDVLRLLACPKFCARNSARRDV